MFDDAISERDLYPFDAEDNDDYVDGSCPDCGAGPDEQCAFDCCGEDEDEEDDLL